MLEYEDEYYMEEDKLGITVTAGSVTLEKNDSNLIGISIGGGGKYCPCLYVVQVFDNTAASRDGTLQSGDEITGVNNTHVKGKTKTEVARLIQTSQGTVTIHFNKLHPDAKHGKTLDISLKKAKHRLVETMSSSTADAFGLSRAILCNDSLVKKLEGLSKTEDMYRALIDHAKRVLKAFFDLIKVLKNFGDVFCSIGVRELQASANEAFKQFGEAHRLMEKYGIAMLKRLKPILGDLGTYLHKAIPDTRLTIRRYADVKFSYLSYCLKVKEMDDEEIQFAQLQEPLYRVETGNYEYRLVLRCRQDARAAFARLRSDVLVKLELLDSKHVQHLTAQLTRFVSALATYHGQCQQLMHGKNWFPIELDLVGTALYLTTDGGEEQDYYDEEDDEQDDVLLDSEEATETTGQHLSASTGIKGLDEPSTLSNADLLGQLTSLTIDDTGAGQAGANMGAANTKGVDMAGANITGAKIVGSQISGANMSSPNMTGANIAGANMGRANIANMTMMTAIRSDLDTMGNIASISTVPNIGNMASMGNVNNISIMNTATNVSNISVMAASNVSMPNMAQFMSFSKTVPSNMVISEGNVLSPSASNDTISSTATMTQSITQNTMPKMSLNMAGVMTGISTQDVTCMTQGGSMSQSMLNTQQLVGGGVNTFENMCSVSPMVPQAGSSSSLLQLSEATNAVRGKNSQPLSAAAQTNRAISESIKQLENNTKNETSHKNQLIANQKINSELKVGQPHTSGGSEGNKSGLSQLSQELMAEPSTPEAFMSPVKTAGDEKTLKTRHEHTDEPCNKCKADGTLAGRYKDASVNNEKQKLVEAGTGGQAKQESEIISLLDL